MIRDYRKYDKYKYNSRKLIKIILLSYIRVERYFKYINNRYENGYYVR